VSLPKTRLRSAQPFRDWLCSRTVSPGKTSFQISKNRDGALRKTRIQLATRCSLLRHLEKECGDIDSAASHRATIGLTMRDWASDTAHERFLEIDAAGGFAWRSPRSARPLLTVFLHAEPDCPRAALMLANTLRTPRTTTMSRTQPGNRWGVPASASQHAVALLEPYSRTLVRDPSDFRAFTRWRSVLLGEYFRALARKARQPR
jgi:hypothetical protein